MSWLMSCSLCHQWSGDQCRPSERHHQLTCNIVTVISPPGRPRHRQAVSASSDVLISLNWEGLPRSCQELTIYRKIYVLLLISLKPVEDFLICFVTVLVIDKSVNTTLWSHETLHVVSVIESHFITNKFDYKYISWGNMMSPS